MDTPEAPLTLAILKAEMDLMREEFRANSDATKQLVEAWNTVSGLARFVKWVASIITALGVCWLSVRHGFGAPKG